MEKVTEVMKGASEKMKETFHHAGEVGAEFKDRITGKEKDVIDADKVKEDVKQTAKDADIVLEKKAKEIKENAKENAEGAVEKSAEVKETVFEKAKNLFKSSPTAGTPGTTTTTTTVETVDPGDT